MHPDERRDPRHLKELVYAQAAKDSRATFDALERANASIRSLQVKAKAQSAKLATVSRQHRALAQENRDLAEELAHYRRASVSISRPNNDSELGNEDTNPVANKVSESLEANRGSSGSNTTAGDQARPAEPSSSVELAPVAAAREAEESQQAESSDIPRDMDPTADQDLEASSSAEAPERLISEMDTSEVLDAFQANPDSPLLAGCLNRLWYREGEIDRAEQLIHGHRDLVSDLNSRQGELVDRILGTVALREHFEQLVPQRVRGTAYHPERKRVLYCAYSTPIFHSNGYSVRTEGVVAGLKASGADVTVLARSGYPWDITTAGTKPRKRRHVVNRHGVEWVHLPEGNISAQGPHEYINVAADTVVRQAKLSRSSVIHAASNYLNALPALIAARRLGLPFVYEVRGLWEVTEASTKPGWEDTERYANQAFLESFVAREADAVLAITQEVKEELVRRGVADDRISLLPNGVDTAAFLPLPRDEAYAKRYGIRTDVPVIGFAGSFVEYEGLHSLLQAANILRGRKVKFQLVLAGAGGVYNDLKEYQKKNRLQGTVRFLGRRPSDEIPRVMSCIDIVACPRLSLPVTEMVSPLKPLEAFSASKPVVLSDVSPHRVLVGADQGAQEGSRGILSTPGDPKSLANALQRLIKNQEERIAMGQAGRLWAVDERQWINLGDSVREAYRSASENYDRLAKDGRLLKDLRIGLIADEFTTETLNRSATIVPLDIETYADQIRAENLDVVFIESAWSGNGGQWHRKVGYYSDEEHEPFRDLLKRCREANVPSVFWNKEDPVHINRFRRTGALCDHVFTTDADMIPEYLSQARTLSGGRAITASSLPFYAQPAIHNPLPGQRPLENTVSYAGTYYGERYPERSHQLATLLRTAKPFGLAIYDRQAAYPDSPYQFPSEFKASVCGALPYDQVIDSYRAHAASLNVNSVAYSPSMFSRRVVEIAACGGAVLSGWSRGVAETFDGAIPCTNNEYYFKALLSAWTSDPRERLSEVWLQLRTVLRSHTVDTALVVLARTAGISVAGFALPGWGADINPEQVRAITRQSVVPVAVRLSLDDHDARSSLEEHGIRVLSASSAIPEDVEYWGSLPEKFSRTWAEDLLQATRWGQWQKLTSQEFTDGEDARHFAIPGENALATSGLVSRPELREGSVEAALKAPGLKTLTLTVPSEVEPHGELGLTASLKISPEQLGTVLIAGHDLKFADSWIKHLRELGVSVLVDEWENHAHHDEQRSRDLLSRADTVFCEWGLGNAVWYSQNVGENHRLVVRVHAQELRGPYLRKINHGSVDQYIFVSELMREGAIASHGVPRPITTVIPNIVRTDMLALEKTSKAAKTIGFVGMVPQMKRLDRAISVIEAILEEDSDFTLRVKGKRPEDYSWMLKREHEMAWYGECYERAKVLNDRHGREVVAFDPYGNDMAEWYRGIGYGISLSDHESFHLTLPDVAASGGVPVSLDWPGADLIYPREWLVPSPEHMARRILGLSRAEDERRMFSADAAKFARERFDERNIFDQLDITLSPGL